MAYWSKATQMTISISKSHNECSWTTRLTVQSGKPAAITISTIIMCKTIMHNICCSFMLKSWPDPVLVCRWDLNSASEMITQQVTGSKWLLWEIIRGNHYISISCRRFYRGHQEELSKSLWRTRLDTRMDVLTSDQLDIMQSLSTTQMIHMTHLDKKSAIKQCFYLWDIQTELIHMIVHRHH